jgi:arylformamidase
MSLHDLIEDGVRLVDLSQPWSADTPTFPTDEAPVIRWAKRLASHGTKHQEIKCTLHIGTHLDAPLHWRDGAMDIATIPLERLMGPATIVDLRDAVSDYSIIRPSDIEERADVRDGDIVILYTGYDRYYLNGEEPDEVAYFFKHPGGDLELASWCVERNLRWLGMDMGSPDHPMNSNLQSMWPHLAEESEAALGTSLADLFPPKTFQIMHTHLFKYDVPIVENLGGEGLRSLLGQRTTLCAFPWRFVGGEAAMVRVVAFEPT